MKVNCVKVVAKGLKPGQGMITDKKVIANMAKY